MPIPPSGRPNEVASAPPRPGKTLNTALLFAGFTVLLLLAWTLLSAPTLRVTPASAHAWMRALDERIAKRMRASLPREADAAPYDWAVPEAFQAAGDPDHRVRAWQGREVRAVLLAPAALRLQRDLLADIAALARANGSCASASSPLPPGPIASARWPAPPRTSHCAAVRPIHSTTSRPTRPRYGASLMSMQGSPGSTSGATPWRRC